MLQFRLRGRLGKLISALFRNPFRMVRQPVFVGIDADEILQRARDTDLLVRLQLGQVDHHVRLHRRATEQIFMTLPAMMLIGFIHVERSAVKFPLTGVADELTGLVQLNLGGAQWISVEPGLGNCHTVNRMPFLGAQIQQPNFQSGKLIPTALHHFIQMTILTDLCKGGIRLRRITDGHTPLSSQFRRHPPHHRFNDRRMGDHVFPLTRTRMTLVMLLHPVRFQHNTITGTNEIFAQSKTVKSTLNQFCDLRVI